MAKSSGERMKPLMVRDPAPVAVQRVRLAPATDGPHRNPVAHGPIRASNALAGAAVKLAASHTGSISVQKQPS